MKFDVVSKALYTDAGELIKVLHCPHRMRWQQLKPQASSPDRLCSTCEHPVLNTAQLSDSEVLAAVRADPGTCVCVWASQKNVTLLRNQTAEPQADRCD